MIYLQDWSVHGLIVGLGRHFDPPLFGRPRRLRRVVAAHCERPDRTSPWPVRFT